MNKDLLSFLKKCKFFQNISDDQLQQIALICQELNVKADDVIITEDDIEDRVFFLWKGEVAIVKKNSRIAVLHEEGSVFGEMSCVDDGPRSAAAHATQPSRLVSLSMNELFAYSSEVHRQIIINFSKMMSHRIRSTNEMVIATLERELEHDKARITMGNLLIMSIVLISFYVLILEILDILNISSINSAFISTPIGVVIGLGAFIFVKKSKYPLSAYGFTTKNWQRSVFEAMMFTLIFIPCLMVYKWSSLHSSQQFSMRVLEHIFIEGRWGHQSSLVVTAFLLLYLLFVPLQEFVARGILQGSFQKLLINKHKVIFAIILSNLLFSMIHIHKSLYLAVAVLIPGLAWGWLYARNPTLIGVTVSHIFIGMAAFFTGAI